MKVEYKIINDNPMVPAEVSAKNSRRKKNERDSDKVHFSIGAKLILIISILVLFSLGSITALVSWLVREDLRVMAEEQNYETNRKNALEAETAFENIKSHAVVLMQVIASSGRNSALADNVIKTFFDQNKEIAAVIMINHSFGMERLVIKNESMFRHNDNLILNIADEAIRQSNPESDTIIFNFTEDFGEQMLGMAFPWNNTQAVILFSPSSLCAGFGSTLNKSYLVNGNNNVLIHYDIDKANANTYLGDDIFIKTMRSSMQRNLQNLYTDENGIKYFAAFTKLNTGGCALITTIEYDKVFEGIAETTKRNIYLTAAVLSISVLLIWFYAKTISLPLRSLTLAAQRIEGGQFEIDIKTRKGKDEIFLLGSSFKKMSRALGIFGRFTNKEIALLAMRGQIKPGGLPKHATIFFSDIRGFTEKSEQFTNKFGKNASDKIVYWLNDYLSRMVECVEKTGGTIDKFIGDAVMAHWGTATTSGSPKRDAINCVLSALMMRSAVVKMNRSREPGDTGNPEINIGCGINTGIVTAGQIGSELRMEYTVIGDPVNLASRIESLCKPLGADILISETTWDMVKDYFLLEEMPSVTVKGKAKPVRIFAVVNFKASKSGPKTMQQLRKVLGIKPPDLEGVNLDAEEKKFKIPSQKKGDSK